MELEEGIERALDGDAVLFVGAGFSKGAINLKSERFLTGSELAALFAARSGLPGGSSLEDSAEAYANKFGEDALINEIKQEFSAQKIQDHNRELARVPWKGIYTTNYDNVL